jgi:hypothetical protein
MRPKQQTTSRSGDLFRARLERITNMKTLNPVDALGAARREVFALPDMLPRGPRWSGAACRAFTNLGNALLLSCILVIHRALPDLQHMKLLLLCGRVVGSEVGILFGAIKPDF